MSSTSIGSAHVVAAGCAGVAVGAGLAWLLTRSKGAEAAVSSESKASCCEGKDPAKKSQQLSTTSSDHDGNVYETDGAVNEYLFFHYGADDDFLPYKMGPKHALGFPVRTAQACIDWSASRLAMLSRPPAKTRALDLGCAVGATSFKLSEAFDEVVGIDFSHAFVDAANKLKGDGELSFRYLQEAEVWRSGKARRPSGANPARIRFEQGDACQLDAAKLGGPFHVVHGANLLCRLPEPDALLRSLPSLVAEGGVVVFISPYSWLAQYTPREHWLGGRREDKAAKAGNGGSSEGLRARMSELGFECVHRGDEPFLIREHARKFQWGCSELCVFQKASGGAGKAAGGGGK